MEKSFDFTRLMKNHEKKHKSKPAQFVSVAGGVQKRLENNLKLRKSSRLTVYDNIRNLSRCASPTPLSEAQQKVENRRQQLVKWKEEKAKKKKEAAAQKKKPFITGVPHANLKFVPPPRPTPSTSRCVTRSQTVQNSKQVKEKQAQTQSFAPKNASFKPPQLKNVPKLPYVNLLALKPIKSKITIFDFDPILPNSIQEHTMNKVKQAGPRTQNKPVEVRIIRNKASDVKTKGKGTKPIHKTIPDFQFQSSSSSETEMIKGTVFKNRKLVPQNTGSSCETDSSVQSLILRNTRKSESHQTRTRKSLHTVDSSILVSKSPRKSTPKKSFQKESKQFTPRNPVPKSESSSEERLRSPTSSLDLPNTPEDTMKEDKISPYVTKSRGKDNARREMKKKLEEGLLDHDTSNIDNIGHFRRQLASEIKRMTEMCDTWDRISEQTVLPESIQECVLGAVGQARLLMSQKLQQFATLVERCARPEPGVALVTPADLHGFWDMVFMQIENVDMRFIKLEELRARGWTEDEPAAVAIRQRDKPVRVTRPKPTGGPSRLKEIIAAARKAKMDQMAAPSPAEKTFEAGFFCVRSPVRSPTPVPRAPSTPLNRPSLLKAVLSNETQKSASRNSASFAMLRASVLGKNTEYEGVALLPQTPVPQTNINATPGRSILKQASAKKDYKRSSKKNIKVVLFNEPDAEMNTSLDTEKNKPIEIQENVLETHELNADSLLSMDVEKENYTRKSRRLVRQEAIEDYNLVMTRSRWKNISPSLNAKAQEDKTPQEMAKTPQEKVRRSTRKSKVLEVLETNVMEDQTPKSTSRTRRGSGARNSRSVN